MVTDAAPASIPRYWQLGIACLMASVGIVLPDLWFAAPLGLALFFGFARAAQSSIPKLMLYGLCFGWSTAAAGIIWFWDTMPLSFLGINDQLIQVCIVAMTWMYVALGLALPVSLAAVALHYFGRSHWFPITAAVLWMLTEIARMWVFAFATWGPQSLVGAHFSAAAVGYTLAENNLLLQLSHPWGLNALNFFAAFCAGFSVCMWGGPRGRSQRAVIVVQMIFGASWCAVSAYLQPANQAAQPAKALRFAVISEHLSAVDDSSLHNTVLQELSVAANSSPPVDVIVLPEEFGLTSLFWSKQDYLSFVERYFKGRDVLLLNSRNELFPAEEQNQYRESKKLIYDSTRNGEIARYTKHFLMPLGEYAPAFTRTFFSIFSNQALHDYLDDIPAGVPERAQEISAGSFKGVRLGGLLCSELFSPSLYNELVREQGVQVLINLANHFWFHGSRTLFWKTLQMARVHAVQNRLPFLMANNMAPAVIIDSSGRLVAQSIWGGRGVLYFEIPLQTSPEIS